MGERDEDFESVEKVGRNMIHRTEFDGTAYLFFCLLENRLSKDVDDKMGISVFSRVYDSYFVGGVLDDEFKFVFKLGLKRLILCEMEN